VRGAPARSQPNASAAIGKAHATRNITGRFIPLNYLILAVTSFSIDPGPVAVPFTRNIDRLNSLAFADALWSKRLDVWTGEPAVQSKIANRLGWLDALAFITPQLGRLRDFAGSIRDAGFTDVVLLGMGGSSLAPEVLRQVVGVSAGFPRFRMLDSVDPDAVRNALDKPETSLFVVASKSGSTIEPNSMAAEARRRVLAAGHAEWGSRFIAITDDNTQLHRRALQDGFREIFVNPADIGGRYSALSFFGLVPAALMGVDLERFVSAARDMEAACRMTDARQNPGLALGALMAAGAAVGRDKLTLQTPDSLRSFGLWVEQLVAESTGKEGKGVIPITGERQSTPWSADRVDVSVTVASAAASSRLVPADAPRASLDMPDVNSISAEFLRWEVATATAGLLLGINPFDEPNVQQAKDATRALLDTYTQRHQLPYPEAHATVGGARLTLSSAAEQALDGTPADAVLQLAGDGTYIGLLAYLPPDASPFDEALQAFREDVGRQTGRPTMFGYGPRYLHSTGQLHKGGPNNGVFVLIAAEADDDLPVPAEAFTFGVLETAQAIGDFQSLDRTGRRAMLVRLSRRDIAALNAVTTTLLDRGRP
jgi:transaldolase/glucose-6-phosphate isomerase